MQRDVLDAEVNRILGLGIELRCNCRVGHDLVVEQIRQEYDAVFIGTGAWKPTSLQVPGENASNVMGAVDFLRRVNDNEDIELGRNVVVVGAGPTAVDVAHLAQGLGAQVTMVAAEITADKADIQALQDKGLRLEAPAVPVAIIAEDGRAKAVRTAYLKSVRAEPTEFDLDANFVIVATDREPELHGFERVSDGHSWFRIDEFGRTKSGIFAGGDSTGLSTVTGAIAQGRLAAETMDREFRGLEPEKPIPVPVMTPDKMKLDWYQAAPRNLPTNGTGHFSNPVHAAEWNEEALINEAKRCMSCGMCMDCETCWMYCSNNCFVRLPKGQHSSIKTELCNGCKKCAEACPSGYIELA